MAAARSGTEAALIVRCSPLLRRQRDLYEQCIDVPRFVRYIRFILDP